MVEQNRKKPKTETAQPPRGLVAWGTGDPAIVETVTNKEKIIKKIKGS